jgi:type IV secretion system protein VirD4
MWNPLYLPYSLYKSGNSDKATELLDDLALNILYDESAKGQDPFWEKTSADYFAGLALALFEDAKEEEINLNSISLMTTVGEEKLANTTYIKEYFSFKDPTSTAYVNASSTLMAPNETKGSILSVFKQKIKLFSSRENLSEMLSNNDFDMRDIGKKKTAVFIVIQDEKKTYHSLVTIFLKQCYETLISVAQELGGKLAHRTNFILDEFANMPPLKDVTTMVTAARSRHMRFTFIIQNFAQLYEVYGKENGETIKGNCGNIVYLISTEISALEEISKMCGEVKSKEKEKTSSTPLVTVSDLQRMKQWDTLILRLRMMPFKTTLTPNFKMNWGVNFPKSKFPQREKQPVHIFDLKSFVDKKREEKINSLMGGAGLPGGFPGGGFGGVPGGGGFGGFPSGGGFGATPSQPPYGDGTANNPFSNAPMPPKGMMGMNNKPAQPPGGGINVEDLVKRIDAKIAELEEEERLEKEKQSASTQTPVAPPKPEPVVPTKPVAQDKPGVSDDQFFDDFFGED